MKIEIKGRKENPLLDREELDLLITHKGEPTPSREEVRNKLVAQEDLDKNKVIIQYIKTPFGSEESKALAKIYGNNERMIEIESNYSLERNGFQKS